MTSIGIYGFISKLYRFKLVSFILFKTQKKKEFLFFYYYLSDIRIVSTKFTFKKKSTDVKSSVESG